MPLNYHIDSPGAGALATPFLRLRGWAFSTGVRISGVRLRVNGRSANGHYGHYRPDVRTAFSDAPDDFTGFEIRIRLPTGRITVTLEFAVESGVWEMAAALEFVTPQRQRPFWLGGGSTADLVAFQLGGSAAHAPVTLQPERFPRSRDRSAPSPLRLTIVTPSFNQANFLPATVASVLAARNRAISYHVQDGGSRDGSQRCLEQIQSSCISWTSEPDAGQADAIARGFSRTSGAPEDLMAWINSDDFYLPGALDYVAAYFARHPEVDVLYGNRIVVDEASREIGRWFLPRHDDEVLRLNDFVPQETMFWRRRIWDKVGGIDPSFKFAMDWDLLLRFQAAGAKIVRVPYFLACFRIHSAQKTSAQMESIGQQEIDALRQRTFGRALAPAEIENHPRLIRYLRKSAWIEFLWRKLHVRHS